MTMPSAKPQAHGRILHVVGGTAFGGGSRIVADIASAARGGGWDVDVLTTEKRLAELVQQQGVGVVDAVTINRAVNVWSDIRATVTLYRLLREGKYDIVHTHTSKAGAIGRLAAYLASVPAVIHTIHNFAFGEETSSWKVELNLAIERLLARASTHLVVVSDHLARQCRLGGLEKHASVRTIWNGIESLDVTPARGRDRAGKVVILNHGRLAAQKGLETLFEAFALIDERVRRNVLLRVVGDGPLRPEIEALGRAMGEGVKVVGFRESVLSEVDRADICVLPSTREGMSIALLEALSAGKCVVASDIPANVEVLGDPPTGLTFRRGDPVDLSRALVRAICHAQLRSQLGDAARQRFVRNYTRGRMCRQYLELYASAVPRSPRDHLRDDIRA